MNFSPTKQKEPLTWVEVSGKTKALTQSGNHYKKKPYVSVRLFLVQSLPTKPNPPP